VPPPPGIGSIALSPKSMAAQRQPDMAQFKHLVEAAKAWGAAQWLPLLVERHLTHSAGFF